MCAMVNKNKNKQILGICFIVKVKMVNLIIYLFIFLSVCNVNIDPKSWTALLESNGVSLEDLQEVLSQQINLENFEQYDISQKTFSDEKTFFSEIGVEYGNQYDALFLVFYRPWDTIFLELKKEIERLKDVFFKDKKLGWLQINVLDDKDLFNSINSPEIYVTSLKDSHWVRYDGIHTWYNMEKFLSTYLRVSRDGYSTFNNENDIQKKLVKEKQMVVLRTSKNYENHALIKQFFECTSNIRNIIYLHYVNDQVEKEEIVFMSDENKKKVVFDRGIDIHLEDWVEEQILQNTLIWQLSKGTFRYLMTRFNKFFLMFDSTSHKTGNQRLFSTKNYIQLQRLSHILDGRAGEGKKEHCFVWTNATKYSALAKKVNPGWEGDNFVSILDFQGKIHHTCNECFLPWDSEIDLVKSLMFIDNPQSFSEMENSSDNMLMCTDNESISHLTRSGFDEMMKSGSSFFIVFYVEICPHCSTLNDILETIVERDDNVVMFKLNCWEENCQNDMILRIDRVPFLAFCSGKCLKYEGLVSEKDIYQWMKNQMK